jgi:hypothetical protein
MCICAGAGCEFNSSFHAYCIVADLLLAQFNGRFVVGQVWGNRGGGTMVDMSLL